MGRMPISYALMLEPCLPKTWVCILHAIDFPQNRRIHDFGEITHVFLFSQNNFSTVSCGFQNRNFLRLAKQDNDRFPGVLARLVVDWGAGPELHTQGRQSVGLCSQGGRTAFPAPICAGRAGPLRMATGSHASCGSEHVAAARLPAQIDGAIGRFWI